MKELQGDLFAYQNSDTNKRVVQIMKVLDQMIDAQFDRGHSPAAITITESDWEYLDGRIRKATRGASGLGDYKYRGITLKHP